MRIVLGTLHIAPASVKERGDDQLVVTLPRRFAPPLAAGTRGGPFSVYDLERDVTGPSSDGKGGVVAEASLYHLLGQVQPDARRGTPVGYYLFDGKRRLERGPLDTREELPRGGRVLAVPEGVTVVSCQAATGCPGTRQGQAGAPTFYYLFKHGPELDGGDVRLSDIRAGTGSAGEGNVVHLGFTSEGNKAFHDITHAEALRGQATADAAGKGGSSDMSTVTRYAQHFAIVLDGGMQSTPYIDYKRNPDGIDLGGSGAEISSIRSPAQAKYVALVLAAGALPAHLVRVR